VVVQKTLSSALETRGKRKRINKEGGVGLPRGDNRRYLGVGKKQENSLDVVVREGEEQTLKKKTKGRRRK